MSQYEGGKLLSHSCVEVSHSTGVLMNVSNFVQATLV